MCTSRQSLAMHQKQYGHTKFFIHKLEIFCISIFLLGKGARGPFGNSGPSLALSSLMNATCHPSKPYVIKYPLLLMFKLKSTYMRLKDPQAPLH